MLKKKMKVTSLKLIKNQEGAVLVIVMTFMALMLLSAIYLANMIKGDAELIGRVKTVEQAKYMAEAGINHALGRIKNTNFGNRTDFSNALDTGSYSVTFSESGGRYLITSVGTAGSVSRTASLEIEDLTPTALKYVTGAGNDFRTNSFIAGAEMNGDIHANNDVYLKSGFLISWLRITGDVSATGIVIEGTVHNDGSWDWWDDHVVINGNADDTATVFEGERRIVFPTFNYDKYRQEAIDSGDYYDTDQVFNGATLSPANGIVFVDGDVDFQGNNTINGGIIADDITIWGTLSQNKSGNRNVVIARDGDIGILGRLYTEEALVYADRDIRSLQVLADIEINGIILARRDIYMWNFLTLIDYDYVETYPADIGSEEDQSFGIISWNR